MRYTGKNLNLVQEQLHSISEVKRDDVGKFAMGLVECFDLSIDCCDLSRTASIGARCSTVFSFLPIVLITSYIVYFSVTESFVSSQRAVYIVTRDTCIEK